MIFIFSNNPFNISAHLVCHDNIVSDSDYFAERNRYKNPCSFHYSQTDILAWTRTNVMVTRNSYNTIKIHSSRQYNGQSWNSHQNFPANTHRR